MQTFRKLPKTLEKSFFQTTCKFKFNSSIPLVLVRVFSGHLQSSFMVFELATLLSHLRYDSFMILVLGKFLKYMYYCYISHVQCTCTGQNLETVKLLISSPPIT